MHILCLQHYLILYKYYKLGLIFVLRCGEEKILSISCLRARRLVFQSAAIPWRDPWSLAEKLVSCCSRTRDGRAFDGCQLQLYISFPSGNTEAECQGLPAQEMVSDLPPSPSEDNDLKPSDLLSRKGRARAGFVPWGMTRFGRETEAYSHWQRNSHHKITLNTKPCVTGWCCYL